MLPRWITTPALPLSWKELPGPTQCGDQGSSQFFLIDRCFCAVLICFDPLQSGYLTHPRNFRRALCAQPATHPSTQDKHGTRRHSCMTFESNHLRWQWVPRPIDGSPHRLGGKLPRPEPVRDPYGSPLVSRQHSPTPRFHRLRYVSYVPKMTSFTAHADKKRISGE